MEAEAQRSRYNKLAIIGFVWLVVVVGYFMILFINLLLGTSPTDVHINILRFLVPSLVIPTILGFIALRQIKKREERGKVLALCSEWSIGLMVLVYFASAFLINS